MLAAITLFAAVDELLAKMIAAIRSGAMPLSFFAAARIL